VLYNAVDLAAIKTLADEPLEGKFKPFFLNIGRLDSGKNQAMLIRIIANLNDERATLEILGKGPLQGELQNLIDELGVSERVKLLGTDKNPFKFIKNGNIFASKCEYIVNPVNVVGVMGKGLALEFKNNFPKHFEFYKKYCDNGMFDIGGLIRYHEKGRGIFCLPTKKHWRDPSKIGYVGMGLDALAKSVVDHKMFQNGILGLREGLYPVLTVFFLLLTLNVLFKMFLDKHRKDD